MHRLIVLYSKFLKVLSLIPSSPHSLRTSLFSSSSISLSCSFIVLVSILSIVRMAQGRVLISLPLVVFRLLSV